MKKILLAIILLFTVSNAYSADHFVKGVYTKDEMTLGIVVEAMFDKDMDKVELLYNLGSVKILDEEVKIKDVEFIRKEEAFVELPTDMVKFKFYDDYRTYYTITPFLHTR